MLLAIGAMCFGCKSDKDKKPPTATTTYLDVENLWAMYYKDMQTVKDSMTAAYVSERDTMIYTQPRKILTFIKDTPVGKFNIECTFLDGKLVEIMARSGFLNLPQEALPHYLTISEEVQNFTSGSITLFPYGVRYFACAVSGIAGPGQDPDLAKLFQNSKTSRIDFLQCMNNEVRNYKITGNEHHSFNFTEDRIAQEYDQVIGQPIGAPELIDKRIVISMITYPNGKTFMYLAINSALNVWPDIPDDEFAD